MERERINVLLDLNLLDTPKSESYDRITRMASKLFSTPIAAVSLTDKQRQWFKSSVGTSGREIPRFGAPCAEVTRRGEVLLIPDMLDDAQFRDCLLAKSGVRFYAGAPLTTRDGFTLGSMCVLDRKPHQLSSEQLDMLRDFAAMVMSQIELEHDLGRVEPLSGLPNRKQLLDDLCDLERHHLGESRVALLIDLSDASHVNSVVNVMGTDFIDHLVRQSSRIIREIVGRKAPIYHVGTAAFLLLLEAEDSPETVSQVSKAMAQPTLYNGVPIPRSCAFGLSPFTLGSSDPRDILRTALTAAHDARVLDLPQATYSPASDDANRRRFKLLTDMREALWAPDQLSLVYQPRVDVPSGRCVGAEALLRWQNPTLGFVSPGEFIPLIEQTALARPVTRWVIEKALDQVAQWRTRGIAVRVSINISARNLEETDFADLLAVGLNTRQINSDAIELEFTESALIRRRNRVLEELEKIRRLGVELAIDDFGTGYSTFSYLHKLPATTVKLDQSFIGTLAANKLDQSLVRSMISMAHDIGYRVVAEGVETSEVYSFLADSGCDEVQGYFIAKPLSVEAFEAWLQGREKQSNRGSQLSLRTHLREAVRPCYSAN